MAASAGVRGILGSKAWRRPAAPQIVAVIRGSVARCSGYDMEYPVGTVAKLTLDEFGAILGWFKTILKEQVMLNSMNFEGKVTRRRKKSWRGVIDNNF